jgi:hypothetical protein
MDIDPMDSASAVDEDDLRQQRDAAARRLSTWVALTVALLATFLGICKVKDDNIVQAMQQAQADRIDQWSFYQARNVREEVAAATVAELQVAAAGAGPQDRARYRDAIARYQQLAAEQAKKKEEERAMAEDDQKKYDALNFRDDQFDLSDAAIAVAISLLAVTALTHKRWLYMIALVPTAIGLAMGLAALAGWSLHPDAIVRLLS